jgi:branched-chain amino acid transport system ATP-binding protein
LKPALSVEDLSLSIGGAKILDGVSLSVNENETLGIIGPNGAGKTTFFNLLSGLRTPTRGSIHLGDRDITKMSIEQRAQLGISRTFQTSSIFPNLNLLENVRIAAQAKLGGSFNITRNAYSFKDSVEMAEACLAQVGLRDKSYLFAQTLSHGDKRRLEIAIVLASDAHIILLDEPMAGMSVEHVPELVEIIRGLARVHHKTVLIVEHHMDVVLGLADRIAVLNFGELLICDRPEKVTANPIVQNAYLGVGL